MGKVKLKSEQSSRVSRSQGKRSVEADSSRERAKRKRMHWRMRAGDAGAMVILLRIEGMRKQKTGVLAGAWVMENQ